MKNKKASITINGDLIEVEGTVPEGFNEQQVKLFLEQQIYKSVMTHIKDKINYE